MKNHRQFLISNFLFLVSCFSFLITCAQWYDPEKINKKAGEIYGRAYEEAVEGRHAKAIQLLNEALALEPKFVDVYLSRAGIYADMKNYQASVADFEKGMAMDSVYASTYLLPFSISLAGAGKFQPALETVNRFLNTPSLNAQSIKAGLYRKSVYIFALEYENTHPAAGYVFAPHNLGDSINTPALEYFPSFTIDGTKMIFTRRLNSDEDFYESDRVNGKWSNARLLGGKINTNYNEAGQTISQDGQLLIYTGCNYPEGEGSCDLYFALKTISGWSEPQNMGRVVNTEFWESSPSLSPDKKDLYFASSRPGGYGGTDIWISQRLPNGKWSSPENAGPSVNTSGDETCPFIHADNQSLFFASNGQKGYGMTDLFVSKKSVNGSWAPAENLGYPINTIDDEGSLVIASDGVTAYYASDKSDGKGGLDIYSFQLREDIRPARTLWVSGRVFDKKTGNGLPSAVELTDVNTRSLISRIQTDEDGNYLVTLPVGKDYAFNVTRKGYLFYSDNFSLKQYSADSEFVKNIPLQPIEAGAAVILKNIFFNSGLAVLKPESMAELDNVVVLLKDNPNVKILISGHTDNVGQDKENLLLSNNRAGAVITYLITRGITAQRLSYKGFGASKPVADNNTESGKALNRRTELSVISN